MFRSTWPWLRVRPITGSSAAAAAFGSAAARPGRSTSGSRPAAAENPWLCVVPRDAQEGEEIAIAGHDFDLLMGQPVVFPLASSSVRPDDKPGALVRRRSRLDPRAAAASEPDARQPQGQGRARAGQPGGAGDRGRYDRALVPVAHRRPPLAAPDPAPRPGRTARRRRARSPAMNQTGS